MKLDKAAILIKKAALEFDKISNALYNVVDQIFIGQGVGPFTQCSGKAS